MTHKPTPPDRSERIYLANLMDGRVDCHVTGRWLQFPEVAMEKASGSGTQALMIIDVMTTYADGDERELCQMVLARDDLLMILNRMPVVPLDSPLPPKTRPSHE